MDFYLCFEDESKTIKIKKGLVCGRDKNSDVVLKDPKVSLNHICFYVEDKKVFVEDLGSANGTFINGHKVEVGKTHPLKNGDALRVGRTVLGISDGKDLSRPASNEHTDVKNRGGKSKPATSEDSTLSDIIKPSQLGLDIRGQFAKSGDKAEPVKSGNLGKRSEIFNEIKSSKEKIKHLEQHKQQVKEKVGNLSHWQKEYIELKEKRSSIREYFQERPFKERNAIAKEVEKCQGDIQNLKETLEKKQKELQELQKIIQSKISEIELKEEWREGLERDMGQADKFQAITEQMRGLKETIEEVQGLQKNKKVGELQKMIEQEQENLKSLQKDYSKSL